MNNEHQNVSAGSLTVYVIAVAAGLGAAAASLGFMVRVGWQAAGSLFG
ncbi:hypothetical protein [Sphingomonas phyllosphaerae]